MKHIVVKGGKWENLAYEIRLQLMQNHLLALSQRRVVVLNRREVITLARQYARSTAKYPWELIYWVYDGQIGASVGLCPWKCTLSYGACSLPGIDDFFASPNLSEGSRRKGEFVDVLCELLEGKGKVIELGRVHNLFEKRAIRRAVRREGIYRSAMRLQAEIKAAQEKGERLAVLTFTAATFYDPFGKNFCYLLDPGLVIGDDLIRQLVESGISLRAVLVATSLMGVETLPWGKHLQKEVAKIWEFERTRYMQKYGVRMIRFLEYETSDGKIITMKWPYNNASRTWVEYGAWLSGQSRSYFLVRRSLSLMRRSGLAPFPWRLNAFVF